MFIKKLFYSFSQKMLYLLLKKQKSLSKFKNIYFGKSCILIGNGPSLKYEDLEKLNFKYSFAANKIYKLFNKTKFRPSFYMVGDSGFVRNDSKNIKKLDLPYKFIGLEKNVLSYFKYNHSNCILYRKETHLLDSYPQVSSSPEDYLCGGYTIIFEMYQLAKHMGFKKIYLIGVDCNYSTPNQHFYNEKSKVDVGVANDMLRAFISMKNDSEKEKIEIYNISRSSKLDVFKRINVDDLINTRKGNA